VCLTLKLAVTAHPAIFKFLWETFPDLYTYEQHLLPLAKILVQKSSVELIEFLKNTATSQRIIQNANVKDLLELFDEE
jgi:hypothetical protein